MQKIFYDIIFLIFTIMVISFVAPIAPKICEIISNYIKNVIHNKKFYKKRGNNNNQINRYINIDIYQKKSHSFKAYPNKINLIRKEIQKNNGYLFACKACLQDNSVKKEKIPKFSPSVRLIGYVSLVFFFLGSIVTLAFISSMLIDTSGLITQTGNNQFLSSESNNIIQNIFFSDNANALELSMFFCCLSLFFLIIGRVLLIKTDVFKCIRCGFIEEGA